MKSLKSGETKGFEFDSQEGLVRFGKMCVVLSSSTFNCLLGIELENLSIHPDSPDFSKLIAKLKNDWLQVFPKRLAIPVLLPSSTLKENHHRWTINDFFRRAIFLPSQFFFSWSFKIKDLLNEKKKHLKATENVRRDRNLITFKLILSSHNLSRNFPSGSDRH